LYSYWIKAKGNSCETNLQPNGILKWGTVYGFCGMIHTKLYNHPKSLCICKISILFKVILQNSRDATSPFTKNSKRPLNTEKTCVQSNMAKKQSSPHQIYFVRIVNRCGGKYTRLLWALGNEQCAMHTSRDTTNHHMPPKSTPSRERPRHPYNTMLFGTTVKFAFKRLLNRFSRFCAAHLPNTHTTLRATCVSKGRIYALHAGDAAKKVT